MASSFTVKAKYQGQTRKFAFQGSYSFPSYTELQQQVSSAPSLSSSPSLISSYAPQLSRVFAHGQAYYLSRLIFAPQPGKQILVGMEVHNEGQWDSHIAPYKGGVYPGAMLKFTVHDELPHKQVRVRQALTGSSGSSSTPVQDLTVLRTGAGGSSQSQSSTPVPHYLPSYIPPPPMHMSGMQPWPQQMSMSAIPPPPIIFSSPPRPPQPMDVDTASIPIPPPPPFMAPSASSHCCTTEEKKQEVKDLLSSFLRDFDRITTSTFGASTASLASEAGTATPRTEATVEAPPEKPPKPWQTTSRSGAQPVEHLAIPGSFVNQTAHVRAHDTRSGQSPTPAGTEVVHRGIWCDVCKQTLKGVRHKCMKCRGKQPRLTFSACSEHIYYQITTSARRAWRNRVF